MRLFPNKSYLISKYVCSRTQIFTVPHHTSLLTFVQWPLGHMYEIFLKICHCFGHASNLPLNTPLKE